jgi:hypothetical protein
VAKEKNIKSQNILKLRISFSLNLKITASLGYPVSGPLLRLTAKRIATKLINTPGTSSHVIEKYSVAEFGESWLDGFKSRHNIRGNIRANGERASLPFNIDELMAPIIDLIESSEIPIKNIYNWTLLQRIAQIHTCFWR